MFWLMGTLVGQLMGTNGTLYIEGLIGGYTEGIIRLKRGHWSFEGHGDLSHRLMVEVVTSAIMLTIPVSNYDSRAILLVLLAA